ncbi:hypothetical protein ACFXHA_38165 [Nocardia sp. NPDC059240]|uniref:DUF6630 family protein n=1 Tax=Nocardia sp. NPDC059240 TaxID=3346786 RepID=UPI003693CBDA
MSDREWYEFASGLAALLIYSPHETVLILEIVGVETFLQFAKQPGSLVLEVSDDLSDTQRRVLTDAGWGPPGAYGPLWHYGIWDNRRSTPDADDCREITLAAIEVLRELLSVPSPHDIHAKGWVDGPGEVLLEELTPHPPEPPTATIRTLLSIAELLMPDHPWPVATVHAALAHPLQAHRAGPWRGLLTALGEPFFGGLGILAQFDAKEETADMRTALRRLPSCPPTLPWDWYPDFATATADWPADDRAEAFLRQVGDHTHSTGAFLISLETDGDDYALTFLPIDRLDPLRALTAEFGKRVELPGN